MADYLAGTAPNRYWPASYWPAGVRVRVDVVELSLHIQQSLNLYLGICQQRTCRLYVEEGREFSLQLR